MTPVQGPKIDTSSGSSCSSSVCSDVGLLKDGAALGAALAANAGPHQARRAGRQARGQAQGGQHSRSQRTSSGMPCRSWGCRWCGPWFLGRESFGVGAGTLKHSWGCLDSRLGVQAGCGCAKGAPAACWARVLFRGLVARAGNLGRSQVLQASMRPGPLQSTGHEAHAQKAVKVPTSF